MAEVILVDSNIPMYLVGGDHPHKADSVRLLESSVTQGWRLVTDAEVLQEISHRYTLIDRRDAIQPAFDAILGTVDEVLPVTRAEAELAKDLLLGLPMLSSRDAIHAAVVKTREVDAIMSFDQGFDSVPGIRRLGAGPG